jgi:hypothetical protein
MACFQSKRLMDPGASDLKGFDWGKTGKMERKKGRLF